MVWRVEGGWLPICPQEPGRLKSPSHSTPFHEPLRSWSWFQPPGFPEPKWESNSKRSGSPVHSSELLGPKDVGGHLAGAPAAVVAAPLLDELDLQHASRLRISRRPGMGGRNVKIWCLWLGPICGPQKSGHGTNQRVKPQKGPLPTLRGFTHCFTLS